MHFDQLASRIENADQSIMRAAAVLRVFDCIRNLRVPQAAKWSNVKDQINAAFIFARTDFVKYASCF